MATVSPMPATEVANGGVAAPDLVTAASKSTEPKLSPKSRELQSRANEYITQEKFNRRFTLPATEAHGELTVTYAVAGLDSADAPTMLFITGMMGGRYLASLADHVATKRGMRVIVADRPGMGGSTPVKPSLRLPVWLETVPVLMRTINAWHVSLSAHSCGVIYALNTIYSMPWILPPSNRKLYLFSPWVPPNHSGVNMLSISSHLPSAIINGFDSVIRFVTSTINPAIHFSSVASGAVSAPFSKRRKDDAGDSEARFRKHGRDDLCREYCGVSAAEAAARDKVLMRCVFSEDISGVNHEVLLSLRKEVAGSWGPCDNYEKYPDTLVAKLREHFQSAGTEEGESSRASAATADSNISATQDSFALKVFWAEKDKMIGKKGAEYFDKCFQRFTRAAQSSSGDSTSLLSYESEVVPDTDHETLCLPQYGALSRMLEDVGGSG
ncbi:hypothetical protein H2200_013374 [Cladophialophora chaetospira]|uniref:AB hydrolase-1 domain-containing protein n=1 Tax=Cladophialophora chaetospira TaxID=386627 RepID=A0AA39CBD4_9EURO|nr:hypothetical protein H2200_013374 [Cladophialophora chaetospira]